MHGLPFISCCHTGAAIRARPTPPLDIIALRSILLSTVVLAAHAKCARGGDHASSLPPEGFNYELIVMYRAAANSAGNFEERPGQPVPRLPYERAFRPSAMRKPRGTIARFISRVEARCVPCDLDTRRNMTISFSAGA